MRPAHAVLLFFALCITGAVATVFDGSKMRRENEAAHRETQALVARLGLTDPVIFTEARYTRHLSQADFYSAFQDHPGALEHFPSGSLVAPPAHLLQRHAPLDREAASSD